LGPSLSQISQNLITTILEFEISFKNLDGEREIIEKRRSGGRKRGEVIAKRIWPVKQFFSVLIVSITSAACTKFELDPFSCTVIL
jgi:hypothetical protein